MAASVSNSGGSVIASNTATGSSSATGSSTATGSNVATGGLVNGTIVAVHMGVQNIGTSSSNLIVQPQPDTGK